MKIETTTMDTLQKLRLNSLKCIALLNVLWVPVIFYSIYHYNIQSSKAGFMALAVTLFSLILSYVKPHDFITRAIAFVTLVANISFQVYVAGYGDFQLDFHMYYFAMLAITMISVDWKIVAVTTVAIAAHHLSLNYLLPYAVFPDGTNLLRVIMHAIAVVIEAVVLGVFAFQIEKIFTRMSSSKNMVAQAIDTANLTVRFDDKGSDDTAEFSKMLNNFFGKISLMISSAQNCVAQLAHVSTSLKQSSEDLTGMSHNQESNIGQLQEAMQHTTEQIYEINQLAEKSSTRTDEMSKTTQAATSLMQNLKESTLRIGDVTKVVLTISEQINLLSLNASIEAARAGEAGRGFAVVAGEVKKLADETNASISQIQEVVSQLNSIVEEATASVDQISGAAIEVGADIQKVHLSLDQQNSATQEVMSTIELFANQIAQLNTVIENSRGLVVELDTATSDVEKEVKGFKV